MLLRQNQTFLSKIEGKDFNHDSVSYKQLRKFFIDASQEAGNLAKNISYRSKYYVPYIDKRFNPFSGPGIFFVILTTRFCEVLSYIDKSFKDEYVDISEMRSLVDLLRQSFLIDDFKNFTDKINNKYEICVGFVKNTLKIDPNKKKLNPQVRIFMKCLDYINKKFENSTDSNIREDIIDKRDFLKDFIQFEEKEQGSAIYFKDIVSHLACHDIFEIVVKFADKLNEFINVPLELLDEENESFRTFQWSQVVERLQVIYDSIVEFTTAFEQTYEKYLNTYASFIEGGVLSNYLDICYINSLIKIGDLDNIDDNIKLIKNKIQDIVVDVPVSMFDPNTTAIKELSTAIFKDTSVFSDIKNIVQSSVEFAKKNCYTYEDLSFVSQMYWYEENQINKLGLAVIYPNLEEIEETGVVYNSGKDTKYILKVDKRANTVSEKNFSKTFPNKDIMLNAIMNDGNYAYYQRSLIEETPFIYEGSESYKTLFFDMFKLNQLIRSIKYQTDEQKTIKIEVDTETSLFHILEIPAKSEFCRGYDLTAFGISNNSITKPYYRNVDKEKLNKLVTGSISRNLITFSESIDPLAYIFRHFRVGVVDKQENLETVAHDNVKNMIDGVNSKKQVMKFSNNIYDNFDRIMTSRSKIVETLFNCKEYVTIKNENTLFSTTAKVNNEVAIRRFNKAMSVLTFNNMGLSYYTTSDNKKIYYRSYYDHCLFAMVESPFELKDFSKMISVRFVIIKDIGKFHANRRMYASSGESQNINVSNLSEISLCPELQKEVQNHFKKRDRIINLSKFINPDLVYLTEDPFYLINSNNINNENLIEQFLNMICQFTLLEPTKTGYYGLLYDHASIIVNQMIELIERRPQRVANVLLHKKFFEQTLEKYRKGLKNEDQYNDIETLARFSVILNCLKENTNSEYPHPVYICDLVKKFVNHKNFTKRIDELKLEGKQGDDELGYSFNIWDILYCSQNNIENTGYTCFYSVDNGELFKVLYCPDNIKNSFFKEAKTRYEHGIYSYKTYTPSVNSFFNFITLVDTKCILKDSPNKGNIRSFTITKVQAETLFKKEFLKNATILRAMTEALITGESQRVSLKEDEFNSICEILKEDLESKTVLGSDTDSSSKIDKEEGGRFEENSEILE